MLENVEHARVVLRQGFEADGEGAVFVRAVEVQQLRARFLVAQGVELRAVGGDVLLLDQQEARADLAGLRRFQFQQLFRHNFPLSYSVLLNIR